MKTRFPLAATAALAAIAALSAGCPSTSQQATPTPAASPAASPSMTTGSSGKGTMTTTSSSHASQDEAAPATTAAHAETNILGLKRPKYDKTNKNWKFGVMDPGTARFDAKKDYFATLHTSLGDITVKFFPDVAPHHVTAFINLAELGFYDDCPVHRIVKEFMMQTGDPTGQGNAGPMYHLAHEFNAKKHKRGILSMARVGRDMDGVKAIDSAGSQFFIMFAPAPFLDNQYTVFGEVTKGLDVLDKFEALGVTKQEDAYMHKKPSKIEHILSVDVFTQDKGKAGKS